MLWKLSDACEANNFPVSQRRASGDGRFLFRAPVRVTILMNRPPVLKPLSPNWAHGPPCATGDLESARPDDHEVATPSSP